MGHLVAGGCATQLDDHSGGVRPKAHVHRPLVSVEVDPVKPAMLEDPSRDLQRRHPVDEKVDGSAEPRADRLPGSLLVRRVLIEVRRDLSGDQSRQLRTTEAVRDRWPAKLGGNGIEDLYSQRVERREGALLAG